MTRGALGWWAVRFLAAAGVSSVACSGPSVDADEGAAAGHAGAVASNGASAANSDGATTNTGAGNSGGAGRGEGGAASVEVGGNPEPDGGSGGGQQVEPDPVFPCLNAVPYGNVGSGLELCDNGVFRRAYVGSCDPARLFDGGCLVDADCPPTSDGGGTICVCDDTGRGTCNPADCATDDDCDAGFSCVGSRTYPCPLSPLLFACQTADDACGGVCGLVCSTGGRPFLIDALPRIAPTNASSDWLEPSLCPSVAGLTPAVRARLATHWQHQAQMEHASVAAFARFVLELLSLGASPELVSAATAALSDETGHARLCYALASTYAEQPLGPAKLDISGALGELGIEAIVTRAVLEGCVGETLAALEASEAACHATDTTLQAVLSRIAEDEARHAELSWRFLSWALAQGGPALRSVVNSAFQCAAADLVAGAATAARSGTLDAQLLAHGVLPPSHAAQLRLTVFESVIRPCVDALLARTSAAGSVTAFGGRAARS